VEVYASAVVSRSCLASLRVQNTRRLYSVVKTDCAVLQAVLIGRRLGAMAEMRSAPMEVYWKLRESVRRRRYSSISEHLDGGFRFTLISHMNTETFLPWRACRPGISASLPVFRWCRAVASR